MAPYLGDAQCTYRQPAAWLQRCLNLAYVMENLFTMQRHHAAVIYSRVRQTIVGSHRVDFYITSWVSLISAGQG
jgi:hypothetical protein